MATLRLARNLALAAAGVAVSTAAAQAPCVGVFHGKHAAKQNGAQPN
jgi:hypothetical protein